MTIISIVWLMMAITGFGFFSGGTTSLALSLILMYGTGLALIVVAAAVYRLLKQAAVRRSGVVPEDTAAPAEAGTGPSAADELLAALRPQAGTGRWYVPSAPTAAGSNTGSDGNAAGSSNTGRSGNTGKGGTAGKNVPVDSAAVLPCKPGKGRRPSLVLAAGSPAPQAARKAYAALSRKRAS